MHEAQLARLDENGNLEYRTASFTDLIFLADDHQLYVGIEPLIKEALLVQAPEQNDWDTETEALELVGKRDYPEGSKRYPDGKILDLTYKLAEVVEIHSDMQGISVVYKDKAEGKLKVTPV